MRQEVKLFINNQEIEFAEPFHINMSFDIEDVQNPTSILNSYSKTVRVEGTDRNNQIFSNLFDVTRIIDGSNPKEFDPIRKNPFELFLNGEKMQEGYCKLDKVERKGNLINYYLTLYGGLGNFFYTLAWNEDGSKKTLADMDFGGGDDEFTVEQKTINVMSAWQYLKKYYHEPSEGYVYDKLNFAITNDGIPTDNFDANKCLLEMYQNPFGVEAPAETGPSNPNGWILAELPKSYSMMETRDIRARLLRPVFRFKYLFNAICDPKQNGGYTVELDPSFFFKENQYYFNAWMTLPNLSYINNNTTKVVQKINFENTLFQNNTEVVIPVTMESAIVDYTKGTITAPFQLSAAYAVKGGKYSRIQSDWNEYSTTTGKRRYYYSNYYVQLRCVDEAGSRMYFSDVYRCHSLKHSMPDSEFGYYPEEGVNVIDRTGWWRWKDENTYEYECKSPLVLKIENMRMNKNYKFEIVITRKSTNNDPSYTFPEDTMYLDASKGSGDKYYTNIINAPMTIYQSFDEASGNSGEYSEEVASGYMLSKKRLMSSDKTPLDYLLSYCKMFGLMFLKDNAEKKIRILSRKTFYGEGKYMDITDKIDYSKPYIVYPLSFGNKWMNFRQDIVKSEFAERYKANTGCIFGEQKVDTNYNFNNSEKNLLKDNAFKNAVTIRARSRYNVNYKPGVIPTFLDGADFKVWNANSELQEANKPRLEPETSTKYVPVYDLMHSNLTLADMQKDGKPVDGADVLLFNDGEVNCFDTHMDYYYCKMTDDDPEMMKLNEGKSCWHSAKNRGWKLETIPQFSRYYTLGYNIYKTFEMGTPSEMFAYDLKYGDNSTIYEQYWKDFIGDQYLSDTRIVECYVLLTGRVMEDYLQKIFYFNNSYWALISITDYDICGYAPTKCKFIKINDLFNYMK